MACIIIIDDKADILETMSVFLSSLGHDVQTYMQADLALDFIENNTVDLVITDTLMPVMNGCELMSAIQTNPIKRDIPIVAMSGGAMDTINCAVLNGAMKKANVFLKKPVSPDVLKKTVNALMQGIPEYV